MRLWSIRALWDCTHVRTHARAHPHVHAQLHARTPILDAWPRLHTHVWPYLHARTHGRTLTYAHTRTHTRMPAPPILTLVFISLFAANNMPTPALPKPFPQFTDGSGTAEQFAEMIQKILCDM